MVKCYFVTVSQFTSFSIQLALTRTETIGIQAILFPKGNVLRVSDERILSVKNRKDLQFVRVGVSGGGGNGDNIGNGSTSVVPFSLVE